MSVDADHLGHSGTTLADVGHLLERVAHAVGPASSTFGRLAAAVSIVKVGARLLPAGGRLLRRHPLGSVLAVAGALSAWYLLRSPASSPHPRLDPQLEPPPEQQSGH